MCAVLSESLRVVCVQGSFVPVEFGVFVHGFAAPPAGCAVGVVVDESGAGFVVCPAAALLGFGEFAVLHVGLGSLGVCWWMCEDLNLMDQRVLAFVKVGLWLADCSPVESHPWLHRVVDAAVFFALCCRVASLLCSRCVVVLAVACSVEGSSRCFVASLSSVCPCRSVLCSMSLLFVSRLLLLRCCAHTPCHACCCVRRRCSDAMFFALRCRLERFARPMHAPACRWCPALSRGR